MIKVINSITFFHLGVLQQLVNKRQNVDKMFFYVFMSALQTYITLFVVTIIIQSVYNKIMKTYRMEFFSMSQSYPSELNCVGFSTGSSGAPVPC